MKLVAPTRSTGSGAFFQVCRAEGATCSSCAPDGSRESVKCQVRQEACAPRWSNQLHHYYYYYYYYYLKLGY